MYVCMYVCLGTYLREMSFSTSCLPYTYLSTYRSIEMSSLGGWAVGPSLRPEHMTASCILDLGKAQGNREALWWGVCVTDEAAERIEVGR